jgi:carbonic anhydrase
LSGVESIDFSAQAIFGNQMRSKHILRTVRTALACALLSASACGLVRAADVKATVTADEAIRLLTAGNDRFVAGKPQRPNSDLDRARSTAKNGQAPFAAVLACADSRVPVETIFDRGIGDLFVVRVAGNVADPGTLGSIEYAAEHLGTPVIVVLGHTQCGAVNAAMDGTELYGNLPSLIDSIRPAVRTARGQHPEATSEQLLAASIAQNVRQQIDDAVIKSPQLRHMVLRGTVKIVGAVYRIETGRVEWLDDAAAESTKK